MKITVCKRCLQVMQAIDKDGKPACLTCCDISPDNSIPIEIDVPEKLTCACGSVAKLEGDTFTVTLSSASDGWSCTEGKITKELTLNSIPFVDVKNKTFYCGCGGWD